MILKLVRHSCISMSLSQAGSQCNFGTAQHTEEMRGIISLQSLMGVDPGVHGPHVAMIKQSTVSLRTSQMPQLRYDEQGKRMFALGVAQTAFTRSGQL